MLTVTTIVKLIGRKNLSKALRVGETAVHNAEAAGLFPASWRDVLEVECKARRIDVSSNDFKRLFKMRQGVNPKPALKSRSQTPHPTPEAAE